MAGQRNLKVFYAGLGVIVLLGVGALFAVRQRGGGARVTETPPPAGGGEAFAGYALGSDSAPVTVVEYADFECPACAQFAVLVGPDVRERLVATGRIRWIFRDFPLPIHRNSMPAHHAAACAGEQGRFFEMHDQLFFNHGRWVPERRPERRFREFAGAIGLDLRRYDECMDAGRYLARLERSRADGAAQGVSATPTFDIGNRRVPGFLLYDDFKKYVDQAAGTQ